LKDKGNWGKQMKNKEIFFSIAVASLVLLVVAVSTAGAAPFAYITNEAYESGTTGTVSVIDTATDNLVATVPVGLFPSEHHRSLD
jgi:YVTN family beta-propeller protein